MPLSPGQIINNRYRIVKLLGQGGFGAVYRAWDMQLSGPCAVKENFDTSPAAQKQFAREASILFNLRHSGLPRVFDHFVIPEQGQYLVMEYIEGEDLQSMLDRTNGPLPEAQVLTWMQQVCDALGYMHEQQPPVIHRDIKPANIRITPKGQAMLVDFGIAKSYDPHTKTTLGARAVTPGFSPYEQYGQGITDTRSDVYSFGATLYTLLTGKPPVESIQRMVRDPLIPPQQLNPAISPSTAQAIQTALQMDPERRFQSAAEFSAALRKQVVSAQVIREDKLAAASHVEPTQMLTPIAPATPAGGRRVNWGVILGMAALIALLLGGVAWLATYLSDRAHQRSTDQTATALAFLWQQPTSSQSPTITSKPLYTNTPAEAPTKMAAATILPSAMLSPTVVPMTPTGTSLPSGLTPVLWETFSSEDLAQIWTMWGTSYSITNEKFELNGSTPTDTGLTSKQNFLAGEGTIIQFEATLMGNSPQDVIHFNWDTRPVNRDSKTDTGPIHIQIGGDKPKVKVGKAELPIPFPGDQPHTYGMQILRDGLLAFLIDGQEIVKLPLPTRPNVNGKISFSGVGQIDNVMVLIPEILQPQPTMTPTARSISPTETTIATSATMLPIRPTPTPTSRLLIKPTPTPTSRLLIRPSPTPTTKLSIKPSPTPTSKLSIKPSPTATPKL